MTTLITPPLINYSRAEPTGSKKIQAKTDPKLNLAVTSVDKKIVVEKGQGGPADLPKLHMHQRADGRTVLTHLNEEGVVTESKVPLETSAKVQLGAEVFKRETFKNPYIKTA